MEDLVLTAEERELILKRRSLLAKRQNGQIQKKEQPQKRNTDDVILGKNRPKGWDDHCDPEKVHKGRLTADHPMGWFEPEIFKHISNKEHQAEHRKIREVLGMPVQNKYKDRIYHALCHLDVLWTEGRLPVRYKHKYEEYKKQNNIGDDNVHPAHKEEGVNYKLPKDKRPWNPEDYQDFDPQEKFDPNHVYDYAKVS